MYEPLFSSFWKNAQFRELFRESILRIGRTCFDGNEMSRTIDAFIESMLPRMRKSWNRFYGSENTQKIRFLKEMESYRSFFLNRMAVVES